MVSVMKGFGSVVFVVVAALICVATWSVAGKVTDSVFGRSAASLAVGVAASPSTRPVTSATAATASPLHASADPTGDPSGDPASPLASSLDAAPSPAPAVARAPVDVNIEPKPAAAFATEFRKTWCAASAVQIALNVNASSVDTSQARQAKIRSLEVAATTRKDSRSGGAGPLGMVATLKRLGAVDYELRIYDTRAAALADTARAVGATRHSAILLAWRGAHAWVMTGYRADADPAAFPDATVTGTYIIDPWYPRVSTIWGRSDGPGVFQDAAEMKRNYLPWARPEGHYPGRDGKFLAIVPLN
jgi:hypothetical protein